MLAYLMDDLFECVIPIMEKITDTATKEKADFVVKEIQGQIEASKRAYDISMLYSKEAFKKCISEMHTHEDPYVAEFANRVDWLLTKGPYFYSDD